MLLSESPLMFMLVMQSRLFAMPHIGSYTSGHFMPLASFINFIRNDHEFKILFII